MNKFDEIVAGMTAALGPSGNRRPSRSRADERLIIRPAHKTRPAKTKLTNHQRVVAGRAKKMGIRPEQYQAIFPKGTLQYTDWRSYNWNDLDMKVLPKLLAGKGV